MESVTFNELQYQNVLGEERHSVNLIESSGFTPVSDLSAFTAPVIAGITISYIVDVGMIMKAVDDLPDIDTGISTIIDAEIIEE
jgi:hypothetical protein